MSDIPMSDDDRQRLVRSRFGELMDEYLNSDAGQKWFDEKVKAMVAAAPLAPSSPQSQHPSRPQPQHTSGRVSAFERFILGIR